MAEQDSATRIEAAVAALGEGPYEPRRSMSDNSLDWLRHKVATERPGDITNVMFRSQLQCELERRAGLRTLTDRHGSYGAVVGLCSVDGCGRQIVEESSGLGIWRNARWRGLDSDRWGWVCSEH